MGIPSDNDPIHNYPLPPLALYLQDLDAILYFRNLCKQEFTEESLDCYFDILRFKQSPKDIRHSIGFSIWETYLVQEGEQQAIRSVNISSVHYKEIKGFIMKKEFPMYLLFILVQFPIEFFFSYFF